MKRVYLIGSILLSMSNLFIGCSTNEVQNETENYLVKGDTVRIINSDWSDNLSVAEVKSLPYSKKIITAGKVRPIPTQYANVASPFSGRIVKSYVKMGQFVKKGTSLFEIVCPDFTSAQKDYFQALSTRELAKKDMNRKMDLSRNGVSSQKELEEAQTALLIAEKDLENAETALNVYQVENITDMKLGQPLIVRAPISGILIENNIVNGQYIKDDDEPVAVVADLSNVWISAQVKEKDIRYISEGDKLNIDVVAYPGEKLDGEVYHIEESLDEDTRSIQVLSVCKNVDEMLKLGMYVNVCFNSEPEDRPIIPETALLQGVDANYVFVELEPNVYMRRYIQVEATTADGLIVSKGLNPGEKIVAKGGYYLKM